MKYKILLVVLFLIPIAPSILADVNDAHNRATDYMIEQTGDIPIVFTAINGTELVVGIDASVLSKNITYTESDIQELLETDARIQIEYMRIGTTGAVGYPLVDTSPSILGHILIFAILAVLGYIIYRIIKRLR